MKTKILLLTIISSILFSCNSTGQIYRLSSAGMLPNYEVGEIISCTKTANLTYGDAIAYKKYEPGFYTTAFGRIVGMAGDTIQFENHQCIINGRKSKWDFLQNTLYMNGDEKVEVKEYLEELPNRKKIKIYCLPTPFDSAIANFQQVIIPAKKVFLVGDNRDMSVDSRTWGCISVDSIIGKAI